MATVYAPETGVHSPGPGWRERRRLTAARIRFYASSSCGGRPADPRYGDEPREEGSTLTPLKTAQDTFAHELFPAPATAARLPGFRPIHYLGSKLRLADVIEATIDSVAPTNRRAVDLFAGSGTVAYALSQRRQVTAVDIQEYSRVLCSALLAPPARNLALERELVARATGSSMSQLVSWAVEPIIRHEELCIAEALAGEPETLCEFLEHGSLYKFSEGTTPNIGARLRAALTASWERIQARSLSSDEGSLCVRLFGGVYFSYRQAAALDSLLDAVNDLPTPVRDYYLAAVLSTASETVNTVGKQFAQPIRPRGSDGHPKRHLTTKIARDRSIEVIERFASWLTRYRELRDPKGDHRAIRSDFRDFLSRSNQEIGVIYADPPYTRDHYSRFYHVLETMCLRDNPTVSRTRVAGRDRSSRGFYRQNRHQSPFCIKSQVQDAFESLFSRTKALGVPLVLSYSPYPATERAHPRLMTVDDLETSARRFFARVEVTSVGEYSHNKFNASNRNLATVVESEVLLVCTN